ncbi:unnamed protein product, partial [Amoebophrya sp. A120]|eukprot:GSA120T00015918001.1
MLARRPRGAPWCYLTRGRGLAAWRLVWGRAHALVVCCGAEVLCASMLRGVPNQVALARITGDLQSALAVLYPLDHHA